MGVIETEGNQMRKSHRIDLPLTVQINDVSYKAKDWSMIGVSLIGFTEDLQPDQVIASKCVLPMVDSVIALNIKLKFKRHLKDFSGFEFFDLSPQVRRVLRQYIEMAVEGKLDSLEDVVGVLTTPALATPLEDALTLSDMEADNMARHFKSGSRLVISVGVLFLIVVLSTLFYNTTYRVHGVGVISNTLARMRAPAAGTVSLITVGLGDPIKKGMPLLSIASSDQQDKIKDLQFTIKQLVRLQNNADQSKPLLVGQLTHELATTVHTRQIEYGKARLLYAQHILSVKDFHYIADQLQNARIAYARNAQTDQMQISSVEGQRLNKLGPLNLQLINAREQLKQLTDNSATINSPVNGSVFHLDVDAGAYVNAGEIVMVLAANTTPDVLLKIPNYDAVKIHVGMHAIVELPFNGQKLQARISAIGYSAVYGPSTPSQEASLNDTLIRLELLDSSIRVPPNTRVNVWIRTFKWPHWL